MYGNKVPEWEEELYETIIFITDMRGMYYFFMCM